MNLFQAAIIFVISLMNKTNHGLPYNLELAKETTAAIISTTSDPAEIETLIKIARWESGGFRKDVAYCKTKGDNGQALGIFQVHPRNKQEAKLLCGSLIEQATIALSRVHESKAMCAKFGLYGADLLAGYTVGSCVRNNPEAYLRWGNGKKIVKLIKDSNQVIGADKEALAFENK